MLDPLSLVAMKNHTKESKRTSDWGSPLEPTVEGIRWARWTSQRKSNKTRGHLYSLFAAKL